VLLIALQVSLEITAGGFSEGGEMKVVGLISSAGGSGFF